MAAPQQASFADRDGWIWLDGEMVPWRDAQIHVLTHALHYASSVFEGQRAYNGVIFKLQEHSERLRRSAELLGFELPWSVEEISAACKQVLKANELSDAYMRPVAWRGAESMGVAPGNTRPHLAIAAWQWGKYYDPRQSENGIRLEIAPWRRPAPYTAPTASKAAGLYMICTLSKQHAESHGYNDAMIDDTRGPEDE
jgi:branched-chain amino acid aminotransferase